MSTVKDESTICTLTKLDMKNKRTIQILKPQLLVKAHTTSKQKEHTNLHGKVIKQERIEYIIFAINSGDTTRKLENS